MSMGNFKMLLSPKPPSANPIPKTLPRTSSASAQTTAKKRTWQTDGENIKSERGGGGMGKRCTYTSNSNSFFFFAISSTCLRSQKVTIFTHPPPPFFFCNSAALLPITSSLRLNSCISKEEEEAPSRGSSSHAFSRICKE